METSCGIQVLVNRLQGTKQSMKSVETKHTLIQALKMIGFNTHFVLKIVTKAGPAFMSIFRRSRYKVGVYV